MILNPFLSAPFVSFWGGDFPLAENRNAKDGLHSYRNMSQQKDNNTVSLEKVIREFLSSAESHAKEARRKSQTSGTKIRSLTDLDDEVRSYSS